MGLKVRNSEQAIKLYESKGEEVRFKSDLSKIFDFVEKDNRINNVSDLAYLLATAKVESGYGLTRWESDFVCRDSSGKSMIGRNYVGVLPNDKPCQGAINYYCSTRGGKKNYCVRDLDKRGLPYFGRGLIQLTWKTNYKKYGDMVRKGLGDELVNNPELILSNPKISYDLAVAFLNNKRGGIYSNRNTFELVKDNEFTLARKSVNGGTKSLGTVNQSYNRWMDVFKSPEIKVTKSSENIFKKQDGKIQKVLGYSIILASVVGFLVVFYKSTKSK